MEPIIKQLYEGPETPIVDTFPDTPEYWEKRKEYFNSFECLADALAGIDEAYERELRDIDDKAAEFHEMEKYHMFLSGFRAGAQLTAAGFQKEAIPILEKAFH